MRDLYFCLQASGAVNGIKIELFFKNKNKKCPSILKINTWCHQRGYSIGLRQPKLASANEGWDYSSEGFYYVTICIKDKVCNLGEIKNNDVYLSEIGRIVFEYWLEIKRHFDFVELDDWIVMPNHLHGIIVIKDDKNFACDGRDKVHQNLTGQNDFGHPQGRDTVYRVSTDHKFGGLLPKSLSIIINTFKCAVVRQCHKNNLDFQWQSNYYEHIITDDADLARIKKYIANNPANWEFDRNNPNNLK